MVGRNIGGRGFNADVWVHERYAYVGSWGFSDWNTGGDQRFCPDDDVSGIAVIDATDPGFPEQVSRLREPVRDLRRGRRRLHRPSSARSPAATSPSSGSRSAAAPRTTPAFFRGLQVLDVTDPADPEELGMLGTGCCTRGLHELEVQHRQDLDKTFVFASVPTSEYPDSGLAQRLPRF